MGFKSLLYPIFIVICIFLVFVNEKKRRQYKKENMSVLFSLDEDDKTMRIISSLMLIFMVISSVFTLSDIAKSEGLYSLDALFVVLLPATFIILYIPMSKKTKVTTLGIFKRSNLVRWEDIKGIDFIKPNAKGRQGARILYRGPYKDMMIEVVFKKDDTQLELFKNTVKEYRNNKKDKNKDKNKDKKIGK